MGRRLYRRQPASRSLCWRKNAKRYDVIKGYGLVETAQHLNIIDLSEVRETPGNTPAAVVITRQRGLFHVKDGVRVEPEELILVNSIDHCFRGSFQMKEITLANAKLIFLGNTPEVGAIACETMVQDLYFMRRPDLHAKRIFVVV